MKNRTGILILTLLVAVGLGTGPALAKTIHEDVTIKPAKTISPAEESIISSAATKVLRHIAKARGAIHEKDLDLAEHIIASQQEMDQEKTEQLQPKWDS